MACISRAGSRLRPEGTDRGISQEDPVDDELIGWCAIATRAACARMTAQQLKAVQDSIGQARCLPAKLAWAGKATAHAQIFNLLADMITDRPVPPRLLADAVGAVYDLMIAIGPAADGIIISSRRRLLDLLRAGDADGAAAEMEQHLRRLHFMGRVCRSSVPGRVAV
jgi:DNA-binding FadR family transcriptional regulator